MKLPSSAGADTVKIHGQQILVRAHVETIKNLSGLADPRKIMLRLAKFPSAPRETFVTHGEIGAATSLQEKIGQGLGWHVEIPTYLDNAFL